MDSASNETVTPLVKFITKHFHIYLAAVILIGSVIGAVVGTVVVKTAQMVQNRYNAYRNNRIETQI